MVARMRLNQEKTLYVTSNNFGSGDAGIPLYAILSHTWGKPTEELTFDDVKKGNVDKLGVGTDKFHGCCRLAKYHDADAEELREAINSMFRWYCDVHVCLVFLADITRGWTLQELLAPRNLVFYNAAWVHLGTKLDFRNEIQRITGGHPPTRLEWRANVQVTSMAQRMSWAASRSTTREEDPAYCLLGIFDVMMPMLYEEAIMRKTRDDSILAWNLPALTKALRHASAAAYSVGSGVLAVGPLGFAACGQIARRKLSADDPLDVRGGNLRLNLRLYTRLATGGILGLLECGPENDAGSVSSLLIAGTLKATAL
ncbi:hypothetical protein B0T24DRAFT_652229 [Lasiosphaeria ovina]|uniref:Uncharacterized protein n=1 Tax=Lasiosphaeria ovina TaxID=92902 RepID=A0AAE0JVE6_9PEZI|nr:hypothetical protein B0T24DRAFT_652229 [Lasiosphaeria ovina]